MQKLLNARAHPDRVDCEYGHPHFTPLIATLDARKCATPQMKDAYLKIIRALLNGGACPYKPDDVGDYPISYALDSEDGDIEVFNLLLPLSPTYTLFECDDDESAFKKALDCKDKELALAMIRNFRSADFIIPKDDKYRKTKGTYVNIKYSNPIQIAVEANRLDAVKLLLSMECGKFDANVTLAIAIDNGSVEMTEFALAKGADVNASDLTKGTLCCSACDRQAVHIVFQDIANYFRFSLIEGELKYKSKLKNILKVLHMIEISGAIFNCKDVSGQTLFDLVTIKKPCPEALLLLIHFDPSWLQNEDLKQDAVLKIYKYVSSSTNSSWGLTEMTLQQYTQVIHLLNGLGFYMPDGHMLQQTVTFVPHRSGTYSKSAYHVRKGIKKVLLRIQKPPTLKDSCQRKIYQEVFRKPHGLDALKYLPDDMLPRELKDYLLFDGMLSSKMFWKIVHSQEDLSLQEKELVSGKEESLVDLYAPLWLRPPFLLICNKDLSNSSTFISGCYKKVRCNTAHQGQGIITAHVKCHDTMYDVIVIHIIASHLEATLGPDQCADDVYNLAIHTIKLFPAAKILISQALPDINDNNRNENLSLTNELIKSKVSDLQNVRFVELNFGEKEVNSRYFQHGGTSLSYDGMKVVRYAIEKVARDALGLK